VNEKSDNCISMIGHIFNCTEILINNREASTKEKLIDQISLTREEGGGGGRDRKKKGGSTLPENLWLLGHTWMIREFSLLLAGKNDTRLQPTRASSSAKRAVGREQEKKRPNDRGAKPRQNVEGEETIGGEVSTQR